MCSPELSCKHISQNFSKRQYWNMTAVESKGPLLERRKERSREAARFRRSKEADLFCQLAKQLPLPESVSAHLDKASVMRMVLSYLRARKLLSTVGCPNRQQEGRQGNALPLQSLEGFLLVVTSSGDIIYITENISKFMGLSQVDLTGHSIYDFTHPSDHSEIRENLSIRGSFYGPRRMERQTQRDFFMRMKCTFTNRGRIVNLKSASWKVLHCTGHLRVSGYSSSFSFSVECAPPLVCVLLCEPIPMPPMVPVPPGPDTPLSRQIFISQHSMDMKFINCDDRVFSLLGYQPEELCKRSAYELCHALDVHIMARSHRILCMMGQVVSRPYRLLTKQGGYAWVETQATVLQKSRNNLPQVILGLNTVLSSIEESGTVFSVEQTEAYRMDSPVLGRQNQETTALAQAAEAGLGFCHYDSLQFGSLLSVCPPTLL